MTELASRLTMNRRTLAAHILNTTPERGRKPPSTLLIFLPGAILWAFALGWFLALL